MPRKKLKAAIEEMHDPAGPIAIFKALRYRPHSFFLDSACDPGKLGRFSFIGCDPFLVFKSKGDSVKLEWSGGRTEELKADPFRVLRKLLKKYEAVNDFKEIPFIGGAVGYFSYDLKSFIEDLPDQAEDDLGIPDCILGFTIP
jgi:para-aminobenzoate synthetase component 1